MERNIIGYQSAVVLAALAVLVLSVAGQSGRPALPPPFATPSATKFPMVIGWSEGRTPQPPQGFQVDLFAANLEAPRWIYVLPNNDVLVAQARSEGNAKMTREQLEAMRKAKNIGPSPNTITLLRDADSDGKFETRHVLLSGLKQPFGMVLAGDYLYVANTDSVVRYRYSPGTTQIKDAGEKITALPAGGYNNHWTRNIVVNPAGTKLYVSVGSQTNVDEEGLDAKDPHRAAILEMNLDGSAKRVFASGLRNPNGMDWWDGQLWTVVNERDETGDDLVPDYLTRIQDGGFYGWPYAYFGPNEDPRHKGKKPDLVKKTLVPDVPLAAHSASLGLVFYRGSKFPEKYRGGAFIGQHGSWNRSKFSGYQVAFVPFQNGRPSGKAEPFLTGFIASDQKGEVYGRPVGVAVLMDGSLLVADDGADRIWRVRYR